MGVEERKSVMRLRSIAVVSLLGLALAVIIVPSPAATVEYKGPELTAGGPGAAPGVVPVTLSLDQAVEIAVRYNPQVASAQEGVLVADAQLTQAASLLLPRVNVVTQRVTPVDLPPFSFQSRESTWETNFSFSQPLYTAGSLKAGLRAADSFRRGAEGTYRRTREQISFAVRSQYYGVLTTEEGVNVAQQVVDSAVETLRVARLRYEAGVAPQFDVLSAEARVARVEQALIAARVNRDIAWASLSTVLGVPIPAGTQLTTPRPVTVQEADPEALRLEALANRPDLAAAEGTAAAARAQVAVAKAGKQPTISAAASYTLLPSTTVSGDLFGRPGEDIVVSQSSGIIALVASWSLFNGGQVYGQIAQAEAQLRQAQDAVTGLKQQIELDVRSAYLSVEAAKAQVAAAQKEAAQAQEAQRIATIRYQEGVGTSVEILSAEADLEGAKNRYNEAIFGLNLAIAQLDLAAGRDAARAPEAGGEQ